MPAATPSTPSGDNMAFLLKKIHAGGNPQYPQREPHQATSFIK